MANSPQGMVLRSRLSSFLVLVTSMPTLSFRFRAAIATVAASLALASAASAQPAAAPARAPAAPAKPAVAPAPRGGAACHSGMSFDRFLTDLKQQAVAAGVSQRALAEASPGLVYDQGIVNRDRGPANSARRNFYRRIISTTPSTMTATAIAICCAARPT